MPPSYFSSTKCDRFMWFVYTNFGWPNENGFFFRWRIYFFWGPFTFTEAKPASKLSMALWRRGGKRKESLQLRLWNLSICIEKVDAKCWLAEVILVMTSLPLARVFQYLFTFPFVSASRWLAEIWQLSRQRATGELEVEFEIQRRSCKLSFLSFQAPSARAPRRVCSQANRSRWRPPLVSQPVSLSLVKVALMETGDWLVLFELLYYGAVYGEPIWAQSLALSSATLL